MARSWVVSAAKTMRRSTAPAMPHRITRARCSSLTREAASPTMMALSPASTTSMTMTLTRGIRFCESQSIIVSSRALCQWCPVGGQHSARRS